MTPRSGTQDHPLTTAVAALILSTDHETLLMTGDNCHYLCRSRSVQITEEQWIASKIYQPNHYDRKNDTIPTNKKYLYFSIKAN